MRKTRAAAGLVLLAVAGFAACNPVSAAVSLQPDGTGSRWTHTYTYTSSSPGWFQAETTGTDCQALTASLNGGADFSLLDTSGAPKGRVLLGGIADGPAAVVLRSSSPACSAEVNFRVAATESTVIGDLN